jgi:hypothetical protein
MGFHFGGYGRESMESLVDVEKQLQGYDDTRRSLATDGFWGGKGDTVSLYPCQKA